MRKIKLYLAAMTLGAFLAAGSMPLTAQAASLSPNAGGTIIDDTDVPLDDGGGAGDVTSIDEGEVPLASAEKSGSSTTWVMVTCGGVVIVVLGLFGAKATGLIGAKATGTAAKKFFGGEKKKKD